MSDPIKCQYTLASDTRMTVRLEPKFHCKMEMINYQLTETGFYRVFQIKH